MIGKALQLLFFEEPLCASPRAPHRSWTERLASRAPESELN